MDAWFKQHGSPVTLGAMTQIRCGAKTLAMFPLEKMHRRNEAACYETDMKGFVEDSDILSPQGVDANEVLVSRSVFSFDSLNNRCYMGEHRYIDPMACL
jgi:hypothetical protein